MSVTEIDPRDSGQAARSPHSRETVTPNTGCTGARRGGRPTNINIMEMGYWFITKIQLTQ